MSDREDSLTTSAELANTLDAMSISQEGAGGEFRKEDLLEALNSIQTPGSFAFSAAISQPPPCDISVPGVGNVRMPLEKSQVRELIAKARQAPYGKGAETIVNTSVRNTWEIDASELTFQNPTWEKWLKDLCDEEVGPQLGITGRRVRAEIYKMLIYEKGAMFKAHTDTQKIPGMFGTLVVVLPSAHEGGEIVLNHCGTKKVFKSSEHTQSFACWYADVSHEILPVKSGYRCILTFNLAVDPASPKSASSPETAPPSASVQGAAKSVLRRGLQRWISVPARKQVLNKLVHVLDHEYNEASIALANLKGRDMAQVQALKELSEELPFEIFFGSMVRETIEYEYFDNGSDDDDGGITDEDFKCKTLFDLDNNKVMKHIEFSAEEQLDERHFEGVQEDDSKPGYEGNQGSASKYWYRVTVVVLVLRDSLFSFLLPDVRYPSDAPAARENLGLVLQSLSKATCQPEVGKQGLRRLEEAYDRAWENRTSYSKHGPLLSRPVVQELLQVPIRFEDFALFEKFAARHEARLNLTFFSWVRRWVMYDENDVEETEGSSLGKWTNVQPGLSVAVLTHDTLDTQLKAVSCVCPIDDSTTIDRSRVSRSLMKWARDTLTECVKVKLSATSKNYYQQLGCEDGEGLIGLARYFPDPAHMFTELVEKVKETTDVPGFTLAFISQLHNTDIEEIKKQSASLYKDMAEVFVSQVDFSKLRGEPDPELPLRAESQALAIEDAGFVIRPEDLAGLCSSLLAAQPQGQDGELMVSLVTKLSSQAEKLPIDDLHSLWMPFLRSLMPMMKKHEISLDMSHYQALYSSIFSAYMKKYVGSDPGREYQAQRDWKARKEQSKKLVQSFEQGDLVKLVGTKWFGKLGVENSLEMTSRSIKWR